tara:strand:- start:10070 stop:11071 length:1002 start_codon:yes stop_codon:yes gene_type:complete
MQRPENLENAIDWYIRRVANDDNLFVKHAVEHWERQNLATIKRSIIDAPGVNRSHLSGMTKFPLILMLILKIEDGRDAKVFADLPTMCKDPRKLSSLIEYIYDVYRDVIGNNRNPAIQGFELPNFDRELIVNLRNVTDGVNIPQLVSKQYAYSIAFYLHWACLNGSFPQNRYYRTVLSDTMSSGNVEENIITPRVSRPATTSVIKTHLKDNYFGYYHMAVSNNCCKAEECTICLEPMIFDPSNKKELNLTDCGHMFHTKCISKWRKPECPVCREPKQRIARNSDTIIRIRDLARNLSDNQTTARTAPVRVEVMTGGSRIRRMAEGRARYMLGD